MPVLTKEQIEERIAALTRQRDDYLVAANSQIARMNGQLDVLKEFLEEPKPRPKGVVKGKHGEDDGLPAAR